MIRQLWHILLGDWSDQVIGTTVPWSERRRRQAEDETARYLLGRAAPPRRWVKDPAAIAEREARLRAMSAPARVLTMRPRSWS